MPNPMPTTSVVNYKGAGNVAVYKLLAGLTLDPTQDGSDVLAGTLEVPIAGTANTSYARIVEVFGNRYLLHGLRVYERDQGGAGNWGKVDTFAQLATGTIHTQLHVVYVDGEPNLVFAYHPTGVVAARIMRFDGTTWTDIAVGIAIITNDSCGHSLATRNKLIWSMQANVVLEDFWVYDFSLATLTKPTAPTGYVNDHQQMSYWLEHTDGEIYLLYPSTGSQLSLARLDGSVLTQVKSGFTGVVCAIGVGNGPTMFSDGDDLIVCSSGATGKIWRIETSGFTEVADLTSLWSGAGVTMTGISGFRSYVATQPSPLPGDRTVYFWQNLGNYSTGTFNLYRFNYRQITHGTVTAGPFIVNELVTQANTNATGYVAEVGGGYLALTNVDGTFSNTDTITGADSAATAAATGLLVDVAPTSLGAGQSAANFSLPAGFNDSMAGNGTIPAKGEARPEFDGLPSEESGGVRRRYFRLYGTGAVVALKLYWGVGRPETEATVSAVAIVSGSPATTPSMNGNRMENFTPDGGVTLYSLDHDASADMILSGDAHAVMLDID